MPATPTDWLERFNAKFIITVRVRVPDAPGSMLPLVDAVGAAGASVGDVRLVSADSSHQVRDLELFIADEPRLDAVVSAIKAIDGIDMVGLSDDVLRKHRYGTIETRSRVELNEIRDLRMVYTPGVASVCQLIAEKPMQAWKYTGKGRRIALVTNGTAVLGLGDIGPLASLPVIEGKSAILAHFVGVSADPILVDSKDPDVVIDTVERIATGYGGIQLEDIAAPDCFRIETELQERLNIPVFHDDQHGTATVVVAALINALRQTGREMEECSAVIVGAGAAGTAVARLFVDIGLKDVVVCDSRGAIHEGRAEGMNPVKEELSRITNRQGARGAIADVILDRDILIGVSRPNIVSRAMIQSMAPDAIVFAMANPVSEIPVAEALEGGAAVAIDRRAMNNSLAFPGIFLGALNARARRITTHMKLAAARSLAESANVGLLPDMLDRDVHRRVAVAVREAVE